LGENNVTLKVEKVTQRRRPWKYGNRFWTRKWMICV